MGLTIFKADETSTSNLAKGVGHLSDGLTMASETLGDSVNEGAHAIANSINFLAASINGFWCVVPMIAVAGAFVYVVYSEQKNAELRLNAEYLNEKLKLDKENSDRGHGMVVRFVEWAAQNFHPTRTTDKDVDRVDHDW